MLPVACMPGFHSCPVYYTGPNVHRRNPEEVARLTQFIIHASSNSFHTNSPTEANDDQCKETSFGAAEVVNSPLAIQFLAALPTQGLTTLKVFVLWMKPLISVIQSIELA